jgi:hypothetical protein
MWLFTGNMITGHPSIQIYTSSLFQKRFSSVKVLRSHIEELPVPHLSRDEKKRLENSVRDCRKYR